MLLYIFVIYVTRQFSTSRVKDFASLVGIYRRITFKISAVVF